MAFFEIRPEYQDRLMLKSDDGQQVTYGDFAEFAAKHADHMEAGTVMAIFCENSIGSVFFYLFCLNHRIVPLLLDKTMDPQLAEGLLQTYQPRYIAGPETGFPGVGARVAADYGYLVLEQENAPQTELHADLALLLTTSGSTGSPKLVRQSRKNITSNAEAIAGYLELDETERPISVLPMHYTYGLSIINSHLQVGAAILLTGRSLFEKEFWSFFQEAGATSISGVPYTYEMLKRLAFLRMQLPTLRTMTQAGGKLSEKLHREFAEYAQKNGKRFIVMYGQTEATARMGYLPAEMALEKCGSMGIAIPGGTFSLIDVDNREITEPDTVGELVYAGDNVTLGYAQRREDLAKGDERGGILHTGDMAKRDADGYYYITGRKKRFLKMFGKRVNMDEIERMVKAEFDGIGAACTGEDDHLRVFVENRDADFCAGVEVWLSEKTGIHASGIRVNSIGEIPKNSAGKIQYNALK